MPQGAANGAKNILQRAQLESAEHGIGPAGILRGVASRLRPILDNIIVTHAPRVQSSSQLNMGLDRLEYYRVWHLGFGQSWCAQFESAEHGIGPVRILRGVASRLRPILDNIIVTHAPRWNIMECGLHSSADPFCVGSVLYDEHVRIIPEKKQRSNCNNHHAVNETNAKRKDVDSTGIVACARHGCFYRHSVVGFKLGEKQVNIDYAISEVFRQLPPAIKQFLCMISHASGYYTGWSKDNISSTAVGKFHLGAHVLECFWEFSLNFMEGAGQVDGEILEILWASLDKVVGSTRSMSRAHRQGVLDDYMNDSNWKKIVGSGWHPFPSEISHLAVRVNLNLRVPGKQFFDPALRVIEKIDQADDGLASTLEAFYQLSLRVGDDLIASWEQEERDALGPGGIGRKIYKAEKEDGASLSETDTSIQTDLVPRCIEWLVLQFAVPKTHQLDSSTAAAHDPGLAEMCLRLTETEKKKTGQLSGSIKILTEGLNVEQAQSLPGERQTAAQKRDVIGKRDHLQKRVTTFNKSMTLFMHKHQPDESDDEHEDGHHNGESGSEDHSEDDDPIPERDVEETEDDDSEGTTALAESMRLSLPSNTKQSPANSVLISLRKQEAALREGQINDSLRKLRLALGDKAWMLRNTVRDAPGGKEKLRAWSGVKTKDKEGRRHVKQYTQASAALRRMGMGAQWKPITKVAIIFYQRKYYYPPMLQNSAQTPADFGGP
ncbi:hypothetical protein GGX14DRAFT_395577 [Mycena pura]|uniref:Uncharacterized protein n=1 Tax=Mycena pura TaxID=153505 RepID=A0AAD6VCE5_9AGAR|nr:hypothetical protein GGX14DRAFT_395577 [Mycena pura]